MSDYIADSSSDRSMTTITDRQLRDNYTVLEANPTGPQIVEARDGTKWMTYPITDDKIQIYPMKHV